MRYKKIILILFLLLVSILLTGCSEKLESKNYIIKKVTNSYKDCDFVNLETKTDEIGNEVRLYKFKNNDFEFYLKSYLEESDQMFIDYENRIDINYMKNLLEFKQKDINNLFEKYEIYVWDSAFNDTYDKSKKNKDELKEFRNNKQILICSVGENMNNEWDNDLYFSFYITKYEDMETIYEFLNDFKNEMKKYFYCADYIFYCPYIGIKIYIQNKTIENEIKDLGIFGKTWYFAEDDINLDSKLQEMQHTYKEMVKEKKIIDETINISDIKPSQINKIYVGDTVFDANKISINELKQSGFTNEEVVNIVYLAKEDKYYIEVGFGIPKDKKSKYKENRKDDYIQKEILEYCYPNCNYKVKGKTTTYQIGEDKFKIKRETDFLNNETNNIRFYKNGKEIKIKQLEEVANFSRKYYTMFIPIEDFTEILGLKIEKYDYENGVIYFDYK